MNDIQKYEDLLELLSDFYNKLELTTWGDLKDCKIGKITTDAENIINSAIEKGLL